MAKAREMLAAHENHERYYEYGGQFLPLTVWAAKGFDIGLIESKSTVEDRNIHPVLGPCFRVRIMAGGSRGSEGTTRTSNMASKMPDVKQLLEAILAKSAPQPVQPVEVPDPVEATPERDGSESDPSDSSDSDSDSSASRKKSRKSKKHSKKSKKSKQHSKKVKKNKTKTQAKPKGKTEEEKRADREQQAAEKASAAKQKATVILAQQVVNKVNAPLNSLTAAMSKPDAQCLPTIISDTAKNHAMTLQGVLRQANRVLLNHSLELTVSSIKEVTKMISEARKHEVLMNQMLTTLSKLA